MATNTQTITEVDTELRELAASVVERAMKAGATAAETVVREGSEFSTVVRMGEVETLKESGSRAIGLRTFLGHRSASTYSSDFSKDGIQRLISGAI
ncbi:MAG TPA: DNA gyrase modulator, partial [Candidatus Angelobacter sp.]